MYETLEWWLNLQPMTDEEHELISSIKSEKDESFYVSDDRKMTICSEYLKRIPYCNLTLEDYSINFQESATFFIDNLFNTFVDDETVVITTDGEHPSVNNNLEKCKNVIYFTDKDKQTLDCSKLNNIQFKKAFVYIIGTHVKDGFYTPQEFYVKIKNILENKNIFNIMVIDDVQGLFLRPRDYSIFDYIVGTAHALVLPYDMGILIHREDLPSFNDKNYCYKWGEEYLDRLDIILRRKHKLSLFNHVLTEHFYKLVSESQYFKYGDLCNASTNLFHIHSVGKNSMNKSLRDRLFNTYSVELDGLNIIRFRAQNYLYRPDLLIDGVKQVEKYIKGLDNE